MQNYPSAISPLPMPCIAIRVKARDSQGLKDSPRAKISFVPCLPTCVPTFTLSSPGSFLLCQLGNVCKMKCCLIKIVVLKIVVSIGKVVQGI